MYTVRKAAPNAHFTRFSFRADSAKLLDLLHRLSDFHFQVETIRHLSQSVAKCEVLQFSRPSLYILLRADVAEDFDRPNDAVRIVPDWGDSNADRDSMPELVPQINFGLRRSPSAIVAASGHPSKQRAQPSSSTCTRKLSKQCLPTASL
jgi:hypothetical protein